MECVAMQPHEKALVQRMQEKPFALLGINNDGAPAEVKPRLVEAGITWRNALEPEVNPLAEREYAEALEHAEVEGIALDHQAQEQPDGHEQAVAPQHKQVEPGPWYATTASRPGRGRRRP